MFPSRSVLRLALVLLALPAAAESDAPRIIVSDRPTFLVRIDGTPETKPVTGTGFLRVVNTKALVLTDGARYYVDLDGKWIGASSTAGPWSFATGPLSRLDMAKEAAAAESGAAFEGPPAAVLEAMRKDVSPAIHVATDLVVLVEMRGKPKLGRIRGTALGFVKNTDADLFLVDPPGEWLLVAGGRWFRAKAWRGPWSVADAASLPDDLRRIPAAHPKGHVAAALP